MNKFVTLDKNLLTVINYNMNLIDRISVKDLEININAILSHIETIFMGKL